MLKYNIEGNKDGELIIFITGAGVGKWMWNSQKKAFEEYKCIFFDLPGHGENIAEEFESLDDLTLKVKKIIQKESKSEKANMIGFSIGAQTILNMIEKYPEHIGKAVIASGLNKPMEKMTRNVVNITAALSAPLAKLKWFAKIQAKEIDISKDMFKEYFDCSKKISKKTLANIMYENMNYKFENKKKNNVQSLILVGEKEATMMKISAERTQKLLENSEMIIVDGAGHSLPYSKSEIFNDKVLEFLKK